MQLLLKIINWLEKYHLNHAVIGLILIYPILLLCNLIGTNWAAGLVILSGYYGREVTGAQQLGGKWKALFPWNWPNIHDKMQTLSLVIVLAIFIILSNIY